MLNDERIMAKCQISSPVLNKVSESRRDLLFDLQIQKVKTLLLSNGLFIWVDSMWTRFFYDKCVYHFLNISHFSNSQT
jgi:hypothetical protein